MARGFHRRALIRYGALGGAAAIAKPLMVARPAVPPAEIPAFALEEATGADLQRRMESGEDSARSLAEKYIARIEAIDGRHENSPALRSVLEVNPDTLV